MSPRTRCVCSCHCYLVLQKFIEKPPPPTHAVSHGDLPTENPLSLFFIDVLDIWAPAEWIWLLWDIHKISKSSPGFLSCSMMSPLRAEQSDLARVNMSSAVFPPPDVDWALTHTHTHTHTLSPQRPAQSQRGGTVCSSVSQLSFAQSCVFSLPDSPPFSTGLITPWDSRPGRQANQHCPPWPALMWRPPPSAGVISNQVLCLSSPSLICMPFVVWFV